MRALSARLCALFAPVLLSACGGSSSGTGGQILSTPVPTPAPTPTPTPAPTPTPTASQGSTTAPSPINFDTAEFRNSTGLSLHGAITAYQAGASGEGIMVGIVDSGIHDAVGEFTGRISALSRDFAGNGDITDVGGHGTAVAATLAAARDSKHVQGMAWGASILALRTDKPGSCTSSAGCDHTLSAMAQAIDFGWRNGAKIINISLGGEATSTEFQAAINRATSAGTIIVVAAGNAETGAKPSSAPDLLASSITNPSIGHGLVIIATSVGADGQVSSFSNGAKGYERTTLAALGDHVQTINHQGKDLLYTGTSFSAPQIAGAAALLAQAFPNLSSTQIVQLLLTTARDAGTSGADSLYGMGVLDIAKAFQPQGQLSLAGSNMVLGMSDITTLSSAMGDAYPTGLTAVALDSYHRPFEADLSGTLARQSLMPRLTNSLAGAGQSISGTAGPLQLALNIATDRQNFARSAILALGPHDNARARFLSGTVQMRLNAGASLALGLNNSLTSLDQMLNQKPQPAFLVADEANGARMAEWRASTAMALRQSIGGGFALTGGFETGDADRAARRHDPLDFNKSQGAARYQSVMTSLSFARHGLSAATGLTLVNERGTMLGARFAPNFGAQSARSLFASAQLRLQPVQGFALTAAMQRGWTQAAAGATLDQGGTLATRSWSLDLQRANLFAHNDLIGLRIAAPLRVINSHFALNLPQSWDWQTGQATMGRALLDLTPRGSERDYELSYGRPLANGWLGANLFLRSEAGNALATPDDYGLALRWSTRF